MLAATASAEGNKLEQAAQILKQQAKRGRGEFITYLTGAASAYRWAGEDNGDSGAPALYCQPEDTKLDGRAYANIALEEYARAKAQYKEIPEYPMTVLALALLHGLQEKYPCADAEEAPVVSSRLQTSSLQLPR